VSILNLNGAIKYRKRMEQVKDFTNLQLNGYTPTDIDFAYDVKGQLFIFGELKFKGVPMPEGQRRFLKAIYEGLTAAGKKVVIIVAEHEAPTDQDIDAGNAIVVGATDKNLIGMTVKQACDKFLEQNI